MLTYPGIVNITQSRYPTLDIRGITDVSWNGKDPASEVMIYPVPVDYSYLETYGITMQSGRFFSREYPSDSENLVINETAAKFMGMENPLGQKIGLNRMNMNSGEFEHKEGLIIGVIRDFHQKSLHNPIEPMIFEMYNALPYASIKISKENISAKLAYIENMWKANVDYPYTYRFLSDTIEESYAADRKTQTIFSCFSC